MTLVCDCDTVWVIGERSIIIMQRSAVSPQVAQAVCHRPCSALIGPLLLLLNESLAVLTGFASTPPPPPPHTHLMMVFNERYMISDSINDFYFFWCVSITITSIHVPLKDIFWWNWNWGGTDPQTEKLKWNKKAIGGVDARGCKVLSWLMSYHLRASWAWICREIGSLPLLQLTCKNLEQIHCA